MQVAQSGRVLRLLVSLVLIGIVYIQGTDPYFLYLMVADMGGAAPVWVRLVQIGDLLLLLTVLGAHVRRQEWAHRLLLGETAYVLVANAGFVSVSGVERFTVGFGSDQYLSLFLLQITARMALVAVLWLPIVRSGDGAAAPVGGAG